MTAIIGGLKLDKVEQEFRVILKKPEVSEVDRDAQRHRHQKLSRLFSWMPKAEEVKVCFLTLQSKTSKLRSSDYAVSAEAGL